MHVTRMVLLLGAVVIAAAGCKSYGKMETVRVSAATTAKAASGASAASLDGGNGLTIDRIRMVVRRISVESPEGSACGTATTATPTMPDDPSGSGSGGAGSETAAIGGSSGDGSGGSGQEDGGGDGSDGEGGSCEFGGGPFLVDLAGDALTGGIHWVAAIEVPAGTYEEVEFDVNTIPATLAGTDSGLMAMANAHASILVDGTSSGGPFTFSTPIEVEQKREGAITIGGAGATNLTLDVDPSGWFKAADGTLLSPSDPTATGAILANIRSSIRIVHDDDRDGRDDEHDGMP